MTKSIPEGLHSVTPALTLKNCSEALSFYKQAFDAVEIDRAPDPSGTKIWHASFRIGDSTLFCNDEFPEMGGSGAQPGSLWIYGDDVDGRFKRAVDAGAKVAMPLNDAFWGDRFGTVTDPWGNSWTLAQRIKNITREEMRAAAEAAIAEMAKQR